MIRRDASMVVHGFCKKFSVILRSVKIQCLARVAKDTRGFVWPSENRESGASDQEKKRKIMKKTGITRPRPDGGVKKTGITRPRPDGGVTRKGSGALDPAVFPPPFAVQNTVRSLKI